MSATVSIKVFDRGATELVREAVRELSPKQLQAAIGPRLQEQTRDHLKALPGNKRGWPSTRFWERAARATRWEPSGENSITLVVDQIGVRQRWKGGSIKPVSRQALTIPISPLSYGKTVADFPGAFLIVTRKGAYIVRHGSSLTTRGKVSYRGSRGGVAASLQFLFKLSAGVSQKADANVMPTPAEYRAKVFAACRERLAGIKARRGGVRA